MKHIFTVHSPVTFLVAISVIKENRLPINDVLILTTGYKPPVELGFVKKSFETTNRSVTQKILAWNTPREQDKYVNAFLENEEGYVAYIDLMHIHQRILVTNKRCLGFSFIEEGTASYILPKSLADIGYIFKKRSNRYNTFKDVIHDLRLISRGYNARIVSMPYTPQSYNELATDFFCFSSFAFPKIDTIKKKVIDLNKLNFDDIFLNIPKLDNEIIWIEESFTYAYSIPEFEYKIAIEKAINSIGNMLNGKTIYLKKRPNQNINNSLAYKILFGKGYDVKILDNDVILEVVLLNSNNCSLVGIISSLLFYGVLFGHKSYSLFDLINNKPQTVFNDLDFYWASVSKIK